MNATTHTRLTVAFVTVTTLLGIGSYADLLPEKAVWVCGIATVILGVARKLIVGVGDALDDGVINGSWNPEAGSKERGAGNDNITRPLVVMTAMLGVLSLLCACEALRRAAVPLAQLGLDVAAQRGVIQPGDRVLIGDGIAYLAEKNATTRDKIMRLSELGLAAAVEHGQLKPGDVLIIERVGAIIERAIEPGPEVPLPDKQPVLDAAAIAR